MYLIFKYAGKYEEVVYVIPLLVQDAIETYAYEDTLNTHVFLNLRLVRARAHRERLCWSHPPC